MVPVLVLSLLTADPTASDLLQKPNAVRLVLSLGLCVAKQDEADAREQIKEERENSSIGGVVDLLALKTLQDKAVRHIKRAKAFRAELASRRLAPMRCENELVAALWSCASQDGEVAASECAVPNVRASLELYGYFSERLGAD